MIASLREYGFLWDKLSAVQKTAEHFKCHDVFLEELHRMADLFLTEEEKKSAARLVEKTEQSDAKQNQRKEMAREALVHAQQRLVETYVGIYGDAPLDAAALAQTLQQAKDCVEECVKCFELSLEPSSAYGIVISQYHRGDDFGTKLDRLSLLADAVKAVEELEKNICRQQVECNVCNNRFYRNRSHRCPYCDADDRERLLIAFLQELQPEAGEKLAVLQMIPSRLVESYLSGRQDIQAQQKVEGGQYDILICPNLASQMDNGEETAREWSRLMKTGGVCLLFPSLSGERQDNVNWSATPELCVNTVGEEWFGAELYQTWGIDKGLFLEVLTKDGSLSEL